MRATSLKSRHEALNALCQAHPSSPKPGDTSQYSENLVRGGSLTPCPAGLRVWAEAAPAAGCGPWWGKGGREWWITVTMAAEVISLAQVLPMGLGDPDSSLSKKVLGGCLPPLDSLPSQGACHNLSSPAQIVWGGFFCWPFLLSLQPLKVTHSPGTSLASLLFLKMPVFLGPLVPSQTAMSTQPL